MALSSTVQISAKHIIILKVLGFASITVVDGKSVTKLTDVLYLIASIFFGVFICYLSIVNKENLATSTSEIADYGNFISYVASIIVSIICMIFVFIFRHRIWEIILKLGRVEDKV